MISLAKSAVTVVPDFTDANSNAPMSNLKTKLEGAKPLGLVRINPTELLVIFDSKVFRYSFCCTNNVR